MKVKIIMIGLMIGMSLIGTSTYYSLGKKCTGSKNCNACKNCKYCKHCAKDGGTCGVCK